MTIVEIVRKLKGRVTRDQITTWERMSIIKPKKILKPGQKKPHKDYRKEFSKIEFMSWFCTITKLPITAIGEMADNFIELNHAIQTGKGISKISLEVIMRDVPVISFKITYYLMKLGVNFISIDSKTIDHLNKALCIFTIQVLDKVDFDKIRKVLLEELPEVEDVILIEKNSP